VNLVTHGEVLLTTRSVQRDGQVRRRSGAAVDIPYRFTRANLQHPTYKALVELGKALRT